MTHEELFKDIPVGRTVARHWQQADQAALDSAAAKLSTHRANPWVFSADARHFEQFAGQAELSAIEALTMREKSALLVFEEEEIDHD